MTMFNGAGDSASVPTPSLVPPGRTRKSRANNVTGAPYWVRSGPCLARFKVTPMVTLGGGGERPYMGACCARCTPHSKKAHLGGEVTQLGIRNLLSVSTADPDRAFLVRTFCYLSHAASREIPLPEQRVSARHVLESDVVQMALEQAVERELPEDVDSCTISDAEPAVRRAALTQAESLLDGIQSAISSGVLRLACWALLHLLRLTLSAVHVHKGQLEVVRSAQAASPGTPLVLLPLHRSHLDYVLLSFAFVNSGIEPPLVAAGDNLRLPLLGGLLRRLGAFFVRRRLDSASRRDPLYRALLRSYVAQALQCGHNLELFIEGGRSRTGRPRPPQAGLLSVVVAAYHERQIEDALLVPVGISYERLVDGNFIGEQLGRPKKPETLWSALTGAWTALRRSHGAVRIDFAQPFKLSEFLATVDDGGQAQSAPSSAESLSSSGSLFALGQVDAQRRRTVCALARHVLHDATRCCAVMSTQLLALLLLHRFRRGCTLAALCNAFSRARDELRRRGVDVGFTGRDGDVVLHALSLLGPGLVTEERLRLGEAGGEPGGSPGAARLRETFIRPVTILPNVLELAYYAQAAAAPLALDAILGAALLSLVTVDTAAVVDTGPRSDLEVSRLHLLSAAAQLADIVSDELLLLPPCQTLDDALVEPVSRLTAAEILVSAQPKLADEDEEWANRAFNRFKAEERWDESDEDGEDVPPAVVGPRDTFWQLQLTRDSREHLLYLQSTLAPLVDAYFTTACCLQRLVGVELAETDFVVDVLYQIKEQLVRGQLAYGESLSAEAVRGALRLFRRWGVLETYQQDDLTLIYLSAEFDSEDAVAEVADRIVPFRK